MTLVYAGLGLIAVAWLLQLYYVLRGSKEIQKGFIGLYMLGVSCLVIGDFMIGFTDLTLLELGTMVAAGLVLIKLVSAKT